MRLKKAGCILASLILVAIPLAGQKKYSEVIVTHGGTIRGTVRLDADSILSSKPDVLDITKDMKCCGTIKNSPRLIKGKQGGIGNAIVFLDGITQGKKLGSTDKFTLTQRRCEYDPHITILPLGSQLEIVNDDPILHNVHGYDEEHLSASIFNIAQPIKGQRSTIKAAQLNKPGLICTSCDAGHPWMSAYIMVAEHPYYALTDHEGRFTLTDIPAGNYQLHVWHEGIKVVKKDLESGKVKKYFFEEPYTLAKDVSISPDSTLHVDFKLVLR